MTNILLTPIYAIALVLSVAGCSSGASNTIDPVTGMPISFCSELRDSLERADSDFWSLGEPTSMDTLLNSLTDVSQNAQIIEIVASEPAKSWLGAVAANAGDLYLYLSGADSGGTDRLIEIAGRWKASYQELPKYCE